MFQLDSCDDIEHVYTFQQQL